MTAADLTSSPLESAPKKGSVLVTGLPRTRSAWLSALFSDEDLPAFHESVPFYAKHMRLVLCDPGAACTYPQQALAQWKDRIIVVIARDLEDSRRSLERWAGEELSNWDAIAQRYGWFLNNVPSPYLVPYAALANPGVLQALYRMVTGRHLTTTRLHLFEGLNIQQQREVGMSRAVAA